MEQSAKSSEKNERSGRVSHVAVDDGTKTLGILSIVFAFVMSLVGLILAIVGTSQAKRIERETGRPAQGAGLLQAGLICSIVMVALWVVGIILSIIAMIAVFNYVDDRGYWYYSDSSDCYGEMCYENEGSV